MHCSGHIGISRRLLSVIHTVTISVELSPSVPPTVTVVPQPSTSIQKLRTQSVCIVFASLQCTSAREFCVPILEYSRATVLLLPPSLNSSIRRGAGLAGGGKILELQSYDTLKIPNPKLVRPSRKYKITVDYMPHIVIEVYHSSISPYLLHAKASSYNSRFKGQ